MDRAIRFPIETYEDVQNPVQLKIKWDIDILMQSSGILQELIFSVYAKL